MHFSKTKAERRAEFWTQSRKAGEGTGLLASGEPQRKVSPRVESYARFLVCAQHPAVLERKSCGERVVMVADALTTLIEYAPKTAAEDSSEVA